LRVTFHYAIPILIKAAADAKAKVTAIAKAAADAKATADAKAKATADAKEAADAKAEADGDVTEKGEEDVTANIAALDSVSAAGVEVSHSVWIISFVLIPFIDVMIFIISLHLIK
jgi:glucose dehydrogenase